MNKRIRKKQENRRKIQRRIQQHYCALVAENKVLYEKIEWLEKELCTVHRKYDRLKDSIVPVYYDRILEFPYGEDETPERWRYMVEHMFEITGESMWKYLVENKLVTMFREQERFSPEYGSPSSPTAVKYRFVLYVKKPNEVIDNVVNFKMKGGYKDD